MKLHTPAKVMVGTARCAVFARAKFERGTTTCTFTALGSALVYPEVPRCMQPLRPLAMRARTAQRAVPTILNACSVRTQAAFTLIEILIATAIFATVLIAMNTVFHGALRLRKTTSRIVEESIPINHALSVIKADLRSILPPGATLAGPIVGGIQSGLNNDLQSRSAMGGGGRNQPATLQFYTTTGATDDASVMHSVQTRLIVEPQPWPEAQRITYYLRPPIYSTNLMGQELVRSVTRNLLATVEEYPVEEPLLDGIENIEFLFYDGMMWRNSWDSSSQDQSTLSQTSTSSGTQTTGGANSQTSATQTGVPQAIRVLIEFAAEDRVSRVRKPPLELVVPVVTEARTNQITSGNTNSQAQANSSNTTGGGNSAPSAGGNNNNNSGGRGGGQPTTPQQPSRGSTGGQRGGGGR